MRQAYPDHAAELGETKGTDQFVGVIVAVPNGNPKLPEVGRYLAGRVPIQREGERRYAVGDPVAIDDPAQTQPRNPRQSRKRS